MMHVETLIGLLLVAFALAACWLADW